MTSTVYVMFMTVLVCISLLGSLFEVREAQAAVGYVNSSTPIFVSGTTSTALTLTLTAPSGGVGDLLIAHVNYRNGTTTAMAGTVAAGWTLLSNITTATAADGQAIYYKVATTATEAANFTWTYTNVTNTPRIGGAISRYSGVDISAAPVFATGLGTATAAVVTAPTVTTTVANSVVVTLMGQYGTATIANPTSMTSAYASANASSGPNVSSSYVAQASAGASGTKASATSLAYWTAHTIVLKPDITLPTVSSIIPAVTATNSASVNYTVTFSESVTGVTAGNFSLTTTGSVSGASIGTITGSGTTWTVPVNTGTGEGTIRLDLSSTSPTILDNASNALSATFTGTAVTIDRTAPANQDIIFATGAIKKGGATVTIVSSGDTTNSVWFAPAGTSTFTAGTTMTKATNGLATSILSPATAGTYYLYVVDAAGNVSVASAAALTVDTTAPSNQNTVFAAAATKKGGAVVTIVSSGDATNNVWFAPSGTTTFTAGATMTTAAGDATSILAPATAGTYYLYVVDQAANVSTASTAALTVDNTAPTNQNTVFAASTFKKGGATVTIVSSGTATNTVWFAPAGTVDFIAGATMTTAASGTSTSILAPATEGVYKLFVLDLAGNVSTASTATLTVDNTPPTNQDIVFAAAAIKKGGATVTITSSGETAVWFAPAGTTTFTSGTTMTTAIGTSTAILAPATAGAYYLYVIDAAGNVSSASTASLTVDNTAPTTQNMVFTASATVKGGASVLIGSSGDATNTVWFAPSGTTTFTVGATMTAAAGDAALILAPATAGSYKLFVLDTATNVSTASTATLTVDNTAPTAAITYTPSTGSYKAGSIVTITATFNESMADVPVPQVSISGSNSLLATDMNKTSATVYTYNFSVSSGNGPATVALSVGTDVAGNLITSVPSSGSTFLVDNAAPSVNSTTPANNTTSIAPNTSFSITWNEAVDCATVTASTVTVEGGTSGKWVKSACSGTSATFTTNGQDYNRKYTVTVGTGVTDVAGNPMAAAYSFSYTTVATFGSSVTSSYYLQGDTTTLLGADGTANLPTAQSTGTAVPYRGTIVTLPTTATSWRPTTTLGTGQVALIRGYSPVYAAAKTITSPTGSFYIRPSANTDVFTFHIYDYNPTSGTKTMIAQSNTWSGTAGTSATVVPTYTIVNGGAIQQNHHMMFEISANFTTANTQMRVYYGGTTATTGCWVMVTEVVAADSTLPVVDAFSAPATSTSKTITPFTITASDNVGVTGFMLTTSSSAPSAAGIGWTDTAPTNYLVATDGTYTLYPWVRDAVGNVSIAYGSPVTVTVDTKLTPVVTWPVASELAYGQTLAASTLTGGSANVSGVDVPGTFTFTNAATPPVIGSTMQDVTFTPTDSAGYKAVSSTVNVTVSEALLKVSPTSYLFGEVSLDSCLNSRPVTFTVSNNSGLSRQLGALDFFGTDGSQFAISSDTCSGQSLKSLGTCTLDVKFCPTSIGSKGAILNINLASSVAPTVTALLHNHESVPEEARRRIPSVLYALDIPETMTAGQAYTITWSLLGYDDSYNSLISFFNCAGINNGSCGNSYGSNFQNSGYLVPQSIQPGDWSYNGIISNKYNYSYTFTAPAVTENSDVVIRFFGKSLADADKGNGGLSTLIPGNLSQRYYDQSGRRILKQIVK